jgi:hypothetical protein
MVHQLVESGFMLVDPDDPLELVLHAAHAAPLR